MPPVPVSGEFPLWEGIATVVVCDPAGLAAATAAVRQLAAAFDDACSSFRPDSELAGVHAQAGRTVRIGPLLADAVAVALDAARMTAGAVDPTVGRALVAHGMHPDDGLLGPVRIEAVPGIRAVHLDADAGTLSVARGVRLDLGATAKALCADMAAAAAYEAAGCGVLVSLLGDVAVAGPAPHDGWRIRVTDDHRDGDGGAGQTVTIRAGGLATSSTTVRRRAGASHLIDPDTGTPIDGRWRTVSVVAPTCLEANVLATAAIVRDGDAARMLGACRAPARLVSANGVAIHLGGWPADYDDLVIDRVAA